jgi:hypothetical protein
MYRRARRRIGDHARPRWPHDRELDDARAATWGAIAAARGVSLGAPSWPDGRRSVLLITHDIDTAADRERIAPIRALERQVGLPSSFGFVPAASWPSQAMAADLVAEGCELYLHDLAHDGRLPYRPERAITAALQAVFDRSPWARPLMRGFRAGQLLWSPALRQAVTGLFEYDLSIPDTERGGPYGYSAGCETVFPFRLGSLLELPLTLPQDVYLRHVYERSAEESLAVWQAKLAAINSLGGVAVLNAHPIWVNPLQPDMWKAYERFLRAAAADDGLLITTPGQVVDWLSRRSVDQPG